MSDGIAVLGVTIQYSCAQGPNGVLDDGPVGAAREVQEEHCAGHQGECAHGGFHQPRQGQAGYVKEWAGVQWEELTGSGTGGNGRR